MTVRVRSSVRLAPRQRAPARGVTLIELAVAIALAATLVSGTWAAWSVLTQRSADPLVMRQALAVAESLLAEVQLQPAAPASGATGSNRTTYASVADYHGLVLDGITDAQGSPIAGLAGYRAELSVQPRALQGVPSSHGWWIEVSVRGPNGADVRLTGFRARR
jgi:MSHA pilin protein MshD